MNRKKNVSIDFTVRKTGRGLLNTLNNKPPVELHIPGYRFCGPGTHLEKRLLRGGTGINPLVEACKLHNIGYSQTENITDHHKAHKILEEAASKRLKSSNSKIGEKMAALGVKGVMKIKRKIGIGMKKI